MPKTRPPFLAEFRREAVKLMRESDKPLSVLLKDLGVSEQTLRTWRRQTEIDAGERDGLTGEQQEELRRLRRENRTLEMEREVLKKPRPSSPGRARGGRRGVRVHRREKANYPVSLMCRVLGVNRTSFHDWERRPPSERALFDAFLLEKIGQVHAASRGTYGSPRVDAELRLEHAIRVGRKRVERLMGGCPDSRGTLSGGPFVPSAPVGSVRGVNQVREDGRYRHAEGIWWQGRCARD